MLKNPEAGPSDTVPAMLTPGEAVIPASAAQDPDNIPMIKQMIAEGRMKNRIAEANGVPVNGKEAIMYDEKKLGFAGGTMNIPEGMHMMPDGTLMRDEDHVGYGHGTMEVPAMIMMAPPKEPTLEKMEALAFKQMDYEQKSKNRTRDTIEKIGLKHLEETADANMKQVALNETMKNYGMEVPMPSQPVPGFADGTEGFGSGVISYLDRFRDLPSDTPLQRGLKYTTGLPIKLVNSLRDVATPDPLTQEDIDMALEADRNLLFPNPLTQEDIDMALEPDRQAVSRIGSYLMTPMNAPPTPELPVEEIEKEIEQPLQNEVANIIQPVPEVKETPPQPENTSDTTSSAGTDSSAGTEEEGLGSAIKGAFKEVFDPTALTKAAIGYGLTRAVGYDENVAAKQAMGQYDLEQKRIAAADAAEKKRLLELADKRRERAEKLEDYIARKEIDKSYASVQPMTKKEERASEVAFQTLLTNTLQETDKAMNRVLSDKKNITDKRIVNLGRTEAAFASEAIGEMKNLGFPIHDPDFQRMVNLSVDSAYRDMVAYANETKSKVSSIAPFIEQQTRVFMLGPSANEVFRLGTREDGSAIMMYPEKSLQVDKRIDAEAREYVDKIRKKNPELKASFDELPVQKKKAIRQKIFDDMQRQFAVFDQDKIKPGEKETAFWVYAMQHYNK